MIHNIWCAHQALPRPLRVQWFVPGTMLIVTVLGFGFTLPSGPLCDEGMVLFMEGGCDWGESNIFFHSKLGTMAALVAGFVIAWRTRVKDLIAFVPHFCIAGALALLTRSGGDCDTYYSHPNGSVGQMVIELAAFGFLGLGILKACSGRSIFLLISAIAGWNAAYVALFYAGLLLTPHWTWSHTWLVSAALIVLGIAAESNDVKKWRKVCWRCKKASSSARPS